ncbi:CxxC motif protein [Haloarcula virus Hardyhisp2]|uniref:CxxC motif protein n=1 Tax=Haloarcula virus Hardyhisp2 TaxID=2811386 RepID=A0A898KCU4_9VIRU|nr:CxxC motif protein [Haloarcula virus Hardyhisp2]QSJ05023.1 CxxC motif protein [Haloarcula virus Hardyhisp2]
MSVSTKRYAQCIECGNKEAKHFKGNDVTVTETYEKLEEAYHCNECKSMTEHVKV